jgi:hypothetical protein
MTTTKAFQFLSRDVDVQLALAKELAEVSLLLDTLEVEDRKWVVRDVIKRARNDTLRVAKGLAENASLTTNESAAILAELTGGSR